MSTSTYHDDIQPVKFTDYAVQVKKQQRKTAYELKLAQSVAVADMYLEQRYLDFFSAGTVQQADSSVKDPVKLRIFRISKLVYDPEEIINDKFISVYTSLHNLDSAVALIVRSHEKTFDFYVATRSQNNAELAGVTLHSVLKGNFPGIDIKELEHGNEKRALLQEISSNSRIPKSLATVSLIPSERDDDKNAFIQGMEKFLGSLAGEPFTMILLASPVNNEILTERRRGFEGLYSHLSPHSHISMSFAHSETDSVNESLSTSLSSSVNTSISNSNGTSDSSSRGTNRGFSSNSGFSSEGASFGTSVSDGSFSSFTSGSTFSRTVSESTGKTNTDTDTTGKGKSIGDTDTTTLNFENKSIGTLLERAQTQLKRIDFSESYGMWDFGAYFFSDDIAVTTQAANVYKSLMMGQESSVERAHINIWTINNQREIEKIVENVKYLKHPVAEIPAHDQFDSLTVTPTNMVNGKELPIVLGFPRKSVPGLAVLEMAEFGRAVVFENPERVKRTMEFGSIYHMGIAEKLRVPMDIDLLSSHCFITGSSGSGKSYATYQLLDSLINQGVHMMVIEPAKGEYKQVFGGLKGIRVYTTDPNVYKFLRVNPFQFPENLHVLTHIEKLIQIFNASWALYAAMPAILKDAVVQAYIKCGWDVMNSVWISGISDHKYPVFKDVLEILPGIINQSDYSADSKGDYKGALVTRVQSMTSGITGLIFERSEGIADPFIFDSDVIIDLSDIGSEETIALLMGVLIMRLGEYRQSVRKAGLDNGRDQSLQHVTVLEEAHNLLKRTSKDQSQEGANIVGKSVEMISNSIKEMRTYGEGFIIIDQSPMAVDTSAIENTSTKIILNTPAKDACEELSSALSLKEEQSKELSRLGTGVAAVFQKGWLTPVLMKVDEWDNRYETIVSRANPDELRLLRGRLLIELQKQRNNRMYSAMALRRIITASSLDRDKKQDFLEIADSLNAILSDNPKGPAIDQVGKLYLMISNCRGLFDVIDDPFLYSEDQILQKLTQNPEWFDEKRQTQQLRRAKRWLYRFMNAFPQYAYVEEINVVRSILTAVFAYLSNRGNDKKSKYELLLRLLHNREI